MQPMRISLREDECNALAILAQHERRDPRAQAALLIRAELERRGLLARENDAARDAMQCAGVKNEVAG